MRRRGGFALLWAMLLVVAVGSMTSVVLTRDLTSRRQAATDLEALRAFHAAEGGLARARHALRANPAFEGTEFVLDACTVSVRVERPDGARWQVVSEAMPGSVRIEATLVPTQNGLPTVRRWRQIP